MNINTAVDEQPGICSTTFFVYLVSGYWFSQIAQITDVTISCNTFQGRYIIYC